ncbi:O-antigen ligase family protein [Arthrobacter zhaoguopingii]|uniref:O-antigen ligase family protein n=1 Tax=Arthrobacter zhaoguopingii TaxID=2681491 RepID=UPI00135ACA9F|nr:O-antigen ligase family protein [Arthrobacter zhaoguopingii]
MSNSVEGRKAQPGSAPGTAAASRPGSDVGRLPAWPIVAAFAGFPLWWALGLGDMAWPVFGAAMVLILARARKVRAPRGFGILLLFLLWVLCSLIQIDEPLRILGFFYRFFLYAAATVVFVYVYNARQTLTDRRIFGVLTVFWLVVVAGGFAGLAFPLFELKTPLAYILPQALLDNSYVDEMTTRDLTQYNPDPNATVISAPRPSAPFLYANGWGNGYSLLTPAVVAYLSMVRGERRFWWLVAALPISFIPAFLTLNRGMFLGLGIALLYLGFRAALLGRTRVIGSILALSVVAGVALVQLPVIERLEQRTSRVSSIDDRGELYQETFRRTLESPVFGYGAPRPSERSGQPSAGTQGHVWLVLFSHGFVGLGLFLAWLVHAFLSTLRRTDLVGLVCNTLLLVGLVEIFYYGILGSGLVILMVIAAVGLRGRPQLPRRETRSSQVGG